MESLDEILRKLDKRATEGPTRSTSSGATVNGVASETGAEEAPGAPECEICDGRRWIAVEAELGAPDFGSVRPCECQERVWGANLGASLRRYSRLGPLQRLTFGTLIERGRDGHVEPASFRVAADSARAFAREPQGWLVLLGNSGTGKTHLAAAVANHLLAAEKPVLYVSVPDLLDHLRSAFDGETDQSADGIIGQIEQAPVLILDDLGLGGTSRWASEKIDRILTHRFNARMPTVVATAADQDSLDERIRTRLFDMILCKVCRLEPGPVAPASGDSGIPRAMLESMTFKLFDSRGRQAAPADRDTLRHALQACRRFAKEPQGWLLLMGGTGTGKTHLATAIAQERMAEGESVLFRFVPDLLDHLRRAFAPGGGLSYDTLFEQVKTADLLILDDLGGESASPWAEEKLYQLIVHRHNSRLPTVITTRLELDRVNDGDDVSSRSRRRTAFNDAIGSRLKDQRVVTVLPISAPDYRE